MEITPHVSIKQKANVKLDAETHVVAIDQIAAMQGINAELMYKLNVLLNILTLIDVFHVLENKPKSAKDLKEQTAEEHSEFTSSEANVTENPKQNAKQSLMITPDVTVSAKLDILASLRKLKDIDKESDNHLIAKNQQNSSAQKRNARLHINSVLREKEILVNLSATENQELNVTTKSMDLAMKMNTRPASINGREITVKPELKSPVMIVMKTAPLLRPLVVIENFQNV